MRDSGDEHLEAPGHPLLRLPGEQVDRVRRDLRMGLLGCRAHRMDGACGNRRPEPDAEPVRTG
jgi:hypothetical protein